MKAGETVLAGVEPRAAASEAGALHTPLDIA